MRGFSAGGAAGQREHLSTRPRPQQGKRPSLERGVVDPALVEGEHASSILDTIVRCQARAAQANQFYNFAGQGFGVGQKGSAITKVEELPQGQTSAPVLPNYLGLPFRIVVSPFVNYNPRTRQTDIMMFNSQQLGALVVKQDPMVQSWDDNRYGIGMGR